MQYLFDIGTLYRLTSLPKEPSSPSTDRACLVFLNMCESASSVGYLIIPFLTSAMTRRRRRRTLLGKGEESEINLNFFGIRQGGSFRTKIAEYTSF